jgi:hypothetical protein
MSLSWLSRTRKNVLDVDGGYADRSKELTAKLLTSDCIRDKDCFASFPCRSFDYLKAQRLQRQWNIGSLSLSVTFWRGGTQTGTRWINLKGGEAGAMAR